MHGTAHWIQADGYMTMRNGRALAGVILVLGAYFGIILRDVSIWG